MTVKQLTLNCTSWKSCHDQQQTFKKLQNQAYTRSFSLLKLFQLFF